MKLTDEQVTRIFELTAAGWTQDQIGIELDLSSYTVGRALRDRGYVRGHQVYNFDDRLRTLVSDGFADGVIANDLGVSRRTVFRARLRLGLNTPSPSNDRHLRARIYVLADQGLRTGQIAMRVHLSGRTVAKILSAR